MGGGGSGKDGAAVVVGFLGGDARWKRLGMESSPGWKRVYELQGISMYGVLE